MQIFMSKIDQLAEALFVKFQHDFPLIDNKGSGKKIKNLPKKSIEQRLGQFYQEAREARKKNRLWVISWARVVLKLGWLSLNRWMMRRCNNFPLQYCLANRAGTGNLESHEIE